MKITGSLLILALVLLGCSSQKKTQKFLSDQIRYVDEGEQFTGFFMVDAIEGDTLLAWNQQRYFIPASNMKVFTLYAALRSLPERIPALKYQLKGDTLHVLGTGDPSALHPELEDRKAVEFIRKFKDVVFHQGNFSDPAWGEGWAWDDFDRYYMPERSPIPIYGNVLRLVREPNGFRTTPALLKDSVWAKKYKYRRSRYGNRFFYAPSLPDTVLIPMKVSHELTQQLWEKASQRTFLPGKDLPEGDWEILAGISSDSLYREMMTVSDNFIAEQLMFLVSSTLGNNLSFESARDHSLKTYLKEIPGPPRWVDGSGLSRYNLCTPESLVYVLKRLYSEIPEARLFSLMARGGERGTLKKWYQDPEGPYVFGKTGSLSNNHNLCGYLRTRSGKTVIFSFMNNHYRKPTTIIKGRMQRILQWVRDNY